MVLNLSGSQSSMKHSLGIILGNQLFDLKYFHSFPEQVFMCEDWQLCTHYKYHKHKIIHFLASMRNFRDQLKLKKTVYYFELSKQKSFKERLKEIVEKKQIKRVVVYQIEDKFFESALDEMCKELALEQDVLVTPMFLCGREEFRLMMKKYKKPLLNNFYIEMRKKHDVLMEGNSPVGGAWNFDKQNRKKIPKSHKIADFRPQLVTDSNVVAVQKLVDHHFADHPGESRNFWIPCERKSAQRWFQDFLAKRLSYFGDYQDALDPHYPFLYHSVISPFLNIGFLTPDEVIDEIQKHRRGDNLNSIEGLIRQILGWREFVRGIYQCFSERQESENFFKHRKKLTDHWYNGTTGIRPLDDVIKKTVQWGYAHHIERLMVVSNIMLLCEVHPHEVHRWFMEMYVDSSDWVMGPNVFGMGQFSDGGLFATKPYISGSNYLLKMSHYKKADWCDGLDGLYWQFIEKNQDFFQANHRMSMMVKALQKLSGERKKLIYRKADELRSLLVCE